MESCKAYELLLRRFGPQVKNVAAIIFMVTRTLADGIRLFATALVISVVTQVPVSWTVIVLGAAMIVYTVRGGVSAVSGPTSCRCSYTWAVRWLCSSGCCS